MKKRLLMTLLAATLCFSEIISVSAVTVSDNTLSSEENMITEDDVLETEETEEAEDTEDADAAEESKEEDLADETSTIQPVFQVEVPTSIESGIDYQMLYHATANVTGNVRFVNKATKKRIAEFSVTTDAFTDQKMKDFYYPISKNTLPAGDYIVYYWCGDLEFSKAIETPGLVSSDEMSVRKSLLAENNKAMSAITVSSAVYTGSIAYPTVTITETTDDAVYTLVKDKDYKLTIVSDNKKKMGEAKVKVEGIGNYAGSKEFTYIIAPATPKITKLENPTASSVKLTWTKSANAEGYYIQRKYGNNAYVQIAKVTSGSTVTYTDMTEGLSVGQTYNYRILAYASSAVESGKEVVSTGSEAGYAVKVKPAIVGLVSLESVSTRKLKLTWKAVPDADGYRIYKVVKGKLKRVKDITSGKKTSYAIGKLDTGYTYQYCVAAYKKSVAGAKVYGEPSATLKARVTVGTPELVSVKSISSTENQITWKKTFEAYGYYVYRKEAGKRSASYKKIGTVRNGLTVTFNDKKASTGKKYIYTVRAYTKAKVNGVKKVFKGAFNKDGIACVAVPAKTIFTLQQNAKGVVISIANSKGANGYYLYRKKGNEQWTRRDIPAQNGDLTLYIDRDVTAKTEYQYYIVPYSKLDTAIVRGAASDTVKFTTK